MVTVILIALVGAFQQHGSPAHAASNGLGPKPQMGWSSWSALRGNISEAKIEAEANVMATSLKGVGFTYINIDSGWTKAFDANGRPTPDLSKFPHGISGVASYVHGKGLKLGIYLLPGLFTTVYQANDKIFGTNISVRSIADTSKQGNTEGNAYRIDYTKNGAKQYIQSIANLVASWGVDYIKFDFVGPGGGKVAADNRADMQQWETALQATGRPIWIELSNNLSFTYASTWRTVANGWRISGDVECYSACNNTTLTNWSKASSRFSLVPKWVPFAGPGGWNDLDSLEVGNGSKDGLTLDERKAIMTLWCISAAPLILGSDLTKLDSTDLGLLTNTEVLAVDQAGHPAHPVSQSSSQQVWFAKNPDGSYTVGLFNLGSSTANVTVKWSNLGISGAHSIRDAWGHKNLGSFTSSYTASLKTHASLLLIIK
ncbi:MAG TPA: glycoside hydrolase family 27 protein [Ktedonobacteraceae bacterium]